MGLPLHDTTKTHLAPPSPLKGVKKEDYPLFNVVTAETFMKRSLEFRHRYNMRYNSFEDLFTVYKCFKAESCGVRSYGILKELNQSEGNYRALSARLCLLCEKGLLVLVGGLYYPTDLCIEEFGKLLG